MRKEPYAVGSIVHVIKRGARGMEIVLDYGDRWRFVLMLRHLNDRYQPQNWFRDLFTEDLVKTMKRPSVWPQQRPLVKILAYTLLDNHFHLILKETEKGGITEFMHRLGISMAMSFNERYKEKGSIFQGPFKSVTVKNDQQLRKLAVYVMVKNTLEMYPEGGLGGALADINSSWEWALSYPYSSLSSYAGVRKSPIIDKDILGEVFPNTEVFTSYSLGAIKGYESRLLDPLMTDGLTLE